MEVQRAHKNLRIFAGVFLVAVIAAGAVALVPFQGWIAEVKRLPSEDAQRHLLTVFVWLMGTGGFAVFSLGIYLWHIGTRICAARRFPLPDSRVIRDTVILQEAAAVWRGRFLQATGVTLMVCVLGLLLFSWRLYSVLTSHAA